MSSWRSVVSSPSSSARRSALPRKQRTGLTRLGRYLIGRRKRVALLALLAVCSASAPVAALLIVKDAIDHGMPAPDKTRLGADVLVYLPITALASALHTPPS